MILSHIFIDEIMKMLIHSKKSSNQIKSMAKFGNFAQKNVMQPKST